MRNCCVICGNEKLENIINIPRFPIFMGTTDRDTNDVVCEDLLFSECAYCKTIQLKNLADIKILYQSNHNSEVVGNIWKKHNEMFANFINKPNNKKILEIGDPSFKICSLLINNENINKWYIVEPNICKTSPSNKVEVINQWFENIDINKIGDVDCIVMSHVFEHLYEPKKILDKCLSIMNKDSEIIISVPNMQFIAETKKMPPFGMHFEHTYFLNTDNLKFLLNRCGLYISEIYNYDNHSTFYRIKKSTLNENVSFPNVPNKNLIIDMINDYKKDVVDINSKIENFENVYIYGSHFPAQLLLALGLKTDKIKGILDNSSTKIGNYLYGTSFKVFHPSEISNKQNCLIVCKMGVYNEEIKENLISINKNVIIM